jgi:hypothetical protein
MFLLGPLGRVHVRPSAYRARHGELCDTPARRVLVRALRVELTGTLAYWTVVDDAWVPVPAADAYLRHLRLGADRAAVETAIATIRTQRANLAATFPVELRALTRQSEPVFFPTIERAVRRQADHG